MRSNQRSFDPGVPAPAAAASWPPKHHDGLSPRQAINVGLCGGGFVVLAGWALQVAGVASIFEPPAEAIMARTPPELANRLLGWLGLLARPAALLGAVSLYLVIGALAGLPCALTRLAPRFRLMLAFLVWLVGAAAAWSLAGLPQVGLVLSLLGVLITWLIPSDAEAHTRASSRSRRRFLTGSAGTTAVVLLSANAVFLSALVRALRTGHAAGARLFAWTAIPARVSGFEQAGLSSEVTPAGQFYVMSKNVDDPRPRTDSWRLQIAGQVERPERLRYEQLLDLPRTDAYLTLRCISNDIAGRLMSTALLSGVSLAALLDRVSPNSQADTVVFHGVDGHSDSLSLDLARQSGALVAYAMNGEALGRQHGFPARLVVPGIYGFKQVKWLNRIELLRGPYQGYWQRLGWTATAVVKTVARIDVVSPADGGGVAAGVAFAGTRGISAVEVRLDGGAWNRCLLNVPPLSEASWVQWRIDLAARRGIVEARAIDGTGVPQEEQEHSLYPDGATGLHRVHFAL